MIDERCILNTLKSIRNSDMENNAFFLPRNWTDLLNGKHIINESLICALKYTENFNRLYYTAKNSDALYKIQNLLLSETKPTVVDILDSKPKNTGAYAVLTDIGFDEYSTFERMMVKKSETSSFFDDLVKTASLDMADEIYHLIVNEFDPINSYLPSRTEIYSAVKKEEILYIGDDKVQAFAYFENTNRATRTLRYLYTCKKYREKGYAERLMRQGMSRGGVKYTLWVDVKNAPARSLYKKFGFICDSLQDMTLIFNNTI